MPVQPNDLNLLLDSIGALPGWLVLGFFWFKLFDVERPRLYWTVWFVQFVLTRSLLFFTFDLWARMLIDISNLVLFPFVASRGHGTLWWRILAIVAGLAGTLTSEMAVTVVLYASGQGVLITEFRNVSDHPFVYCFFQGLMALVFAAVSCALYALLRRVGRKEADPTCLWFALFLLTQVFIVIVVLATCQYNSWGNPPVMIASFIFALTSLVLDAILLGVASQASATTARQRRNELLKNQLEACITHYQDIVAQEEHLARFRHDLRGELQTVDALVAAGNYQRALSLVDQLQKQLGFSSKERG